MVKDITLSEMKAITDKVYLSCESCRGRLYEVNKNKLRSPIQASMFMPVVGVAVCWPSRANQFDIKCPRCGLGPMRKINEITVEYGKSQLAHIKLQANRPIFIADGKAQCPLCDGVFDRRGIKTHILHCKGVAND